MSEYVIRETTSTTGMLKIAEQFPIQTNHHDPLSEHGWTMLAVLQKAAGEPCHRAEYGWQGECQNVQDSGPDMHYACARCLARAFLRELAEKAKQQGAGNPYEDQTCAECRYGAIDNTGLCVIDAAHKAAA